ncbi:hypothetical protein V1478_007757 [Vespula squamosa]|uniref:Uncharacterized protein n=1 Tax=Vespula squamosa TaxID=30214 RepID=A0ABD2AWT4_VESSQ
MPRGLYCSTGVSRRGYSQCLSKIVPRNTLDIAISYVKQVHSSKTFVLALRLGCFALLCVGLGWVGFGWTGLGCVWVGLRYHLALRRLTYRGKMWIFIDESKLLTVVKLCRRRVTFIIRHTQETLWMKFNDDQRENPIYRDTEQNDQSTSNV